MVKEIIIKRDQKTVITQGETARFLFLIKNKKRKERKKKIERKTRRL